MTLEGEFGEALGFTLQEVLNLVKYSGAKVDFDKIRFMSKEFEQLFNEQLSRGEMAIMLATFLGTELQALVKKDGAQVLHEAAARVR